jgi:hypothetical protein
VVLVGEVGSEDRGTVISSETDKQKSICQLHSADIIADLPDFADLGLGQEFVMFFSLLDSKLSVGVLYLVSYQTNTERCARTGDMCTSVGIFGSDLTLIIYDVFAFDLDQSTFRRPLGRRVHLNIVPSPGERERVMVTRHV